MRTFFFDKSLADGHATTDAEIEQRLATIEKSGMLCLGVLHNIFDLMETSQILLQSSVPMHFNPGYRLELPLLVSLTRQVMEATGAWTCLTLKLISQSLSTMPSKL
jgi:hypothetical protein